MCGVLNSGRRWNSNPINSTALKPTYLQAIRRKANSRCPIQDKPLTPSWIPFGCRPENKTSPTNAILFGSFPTWKPVRGSRASCLQQCLSDVFTEWRKTRHWSENLTGAGDEGKPRIVAESVRILQKFPLSRTGIRKKYSGNFFHEKRSTASRPYMFFDDPISGFKNNLWLWS